MFHNDFIANLPLSLPVKEFWKSVNIWRSYRQKYSGVFFDSQCTLHKYAISSVWPNNNCVRSQPLTYSVNIHCVRKKVTPTECEIEMLSLNTSCPDFVSLIPKYFVRKWQNSVSSVSTVTLHWKPKCFVIKIQRLITMLSENICQ